MIAAGRVAVNGRVIDSPALERHRRRPVDRRRQAAGRAGAGAALALLQAARASSPASATRRAATPSSPTCRRRCRGWSRVGRLDLNSEGLLLLTNDGALKRRLELPSTGWLRKYRVRALGEPGRRGAGAAPARDHRRRRALPADAGRHRPPAGRERLADGGDPRGQEPRGAPGAARRSGSTVNRLIRVSYGPFQLGDLEPGGGRGGAAEGAARAARAGEGGRSAARGLRQAKDLKRLRKRGMERV